MRPQTTELLISCAIVIFVLTFMLLVLRRLSCIQRIASAHLKVLEQLRDHTMANPPQLAAGDSMAARRNPAERPSAPPPSPESLPDNPKIRTEQTLEHPESGVYRDGRTPPP